MDSMRLLVSLVKISDNGSLWLSNEGISDRLRLPKKTVNRLIKELEVSNLISYEIEQRSYLPIIRIKIDKEIYKTIQETLSKSKRSFKKQYKF